jgi:hypothetical protein
LWICDGEFDTFFRNSQKKGFCLIRKSRFWRFLGRNSLFWGEIPRENFGLGRVLGGFLVNLGSLGSLERLGSLGSLGSLGWGFARCFVWRFARVACVVVCVAVCVGLCVVVFEGVWDGLYLRYT